MSEDHLDDGPQDLRGATDMLGKLAEETLAQQGSDDDAPDASDTEQDDAVGDAAGGEQDAPDPVDSEDNEGADDAVHGDEDDDEPLAASDGDDVLPATLSELAEALEVDESYVRGLTVTAKINGEDRSVTLDEALSGIGKAAEVSDLEAGRKSLADARSAFEAEKTQQAEQIQTVLASLDSLIAQDEPEDLEALADEDPVAYIQAVQQAQKREKAVAKARQEAEELLKGQQEEQAGKLKELAASEATKFRSAHPELAEDKTFNDEMTQTVAFLRNAGFSVDEIKNTIDSRVWGVALRAMRFERSANKAPDTRRKVKKLPKVLRPGTTEGKRTAGTERLAKARKRLKNSGSVDDAVALMKQLAN